MTAAPPDPAPASPAPSGADVQATFAATLVDEWCRAGTTDAVVCPGSRSTPLALALADAAADGRLRLHVHIDPRHGRLREPHDRRKRLGITQRQRLVLHWSALVERVGARCAVDVIDAVAHAIRCQPPRAAIATLDSVLNRGLITMAQVRDLFEILPPRFRALEPLIDARAESGPESLVRLMARMLGCDIRLQVSFDGIGRVDLVLDGWLVVECDSKQFHSSWAEQARDRERDLALAALGYSTLRLTAAMIMYRPDEVFAALRSLIRSRRAA